MCIPNWVAWVHAPAGTRASRNEGSVSIALGIAAAHALSNANEDTEPLRADPSYTQQDVPLSSVSGSLAGD